MRFFRTLSFLTLGLLSTHAFSAEQGVNAGTINRIADEEFNHGQVVDLAAYLADQIGGRMTNSPSMRKAEAWSKGMFSSWGLKNVHAEAYDFGRGWWIESARTRMMTPRVLELRSIPIAWTPPTNGALSAAIIVAPIRKANDLADWKGKVAGKIVLISYPDPINDETKPAFSRLDAAEIGKLNTYHEPSYDPEDEKKSLERFITIRKTISEFMAAEGALALVRMSRSNDGLVHGEGYFHQANDTLKLPEVEVAAEDYRRLARLAKVGEVKLEIDSKVHFEDGDHNGYNIIAEIPGTDPKAGYVMAGAHLDSWVAGDGAADNGAGAVIVMEAARLLSHSGIKPKRSIRFALWSGEEQGLYGSSAYVAQHLAKRPLPTDPVLAGLPSFFWSTYPITPLAEFNEMDGYFNLDNGSGKIRGIYAEGNFAAIPVLRNWLSPFDSLGANQVVAEPTGATDHVPMVRLGLPAFQFIQDPLDYDSKVHHTNLDTFDHLRTNDLRQAAFVMATVLLQAADSDVALARNVLPTQPNVTDPFKYQDPAQK